MFLKVENYHFSTMKISFEHLKIVLHRSIASEFCNNAYPSFNIETLPNPAGIPNFYEFLKIAEILLPFLETDIGNTVLIYHYYPHSLLVA